MKVAIREFTRSLDEQSVGLFYYADHGMELEGNNYLIPVDANIANEEDVEFDGINAGHLLNRLKRSNNGFNVVILDACRNKEVRGILQNSDDGIMLRGEVFGLEKSGSGPHVQQPKTWVLTKQK